VGTGLILIVAADDPDRQMTPIDLSDAARETGVVGFQVPTGRQGANRQSDRFLI
jgi:hypothetical protein